MAELDAAVSKATSVREEEKAKNTVTIKGSQDAQPAVAQALRCSDLVRRRRD